LRENFVKFRTSDLDYLSGSIAFSLSCGNELIEYGRETKAHTAYECENDINYVALIMENLPGNTPSGPLGDGNWKLYRDKSDIDEVWMCQNDADGDGSFRVRYDTDDADGSVSTSPLEENAVFEEMC